MKPPRLRARPIAEGVLRFLSYEQVIWREYLWNNGQVARMWFVDPGEVDELAVETRPLTSNDCSTGTD